MLVLARSETGQSGVVLVLARSKTGQSGVVLVLARSETGQSGSGSLFLGDDALLEGVLMLRKDEG